MQQIKPSRASVPAATLRRFDVFVVEDYTKDGAEKANWIRLGVAFENKDGKGFNIQIDVVPLPSLRCTTWMSRAGNFLPGLLTAIDGSFHFFTWPR